MYKLRIFILFVNPINTQKKFLFIYTTYIYIVNLHYFYNQIYRKHKKAPPRKFLSRAFLLYITFRDNEWWRRGELNPVLLH